MGDERVWGIGRDRWYMVWVKGVVVGELDVGVLRGLVVIED